MGFLDDRCPECGIDPSTIKPPDAIAAVRSYPRRYRRLLVRLDDEEGAGIVTRRPGPDQWSALEHAVHVADALEAVARALEQVRVHDDPSIDVAVRPPRFEPVDGVLGRLRAASERLASVADVVAGKDWQRSGRLPDGEAVTALALLRHAVHLGAHHRRAMERVMSTVR